MTTLEKYIWIVQTLHRAGERGISLKELNEKWMLDEEMSNGEPLPRQTFDRWKGNILMTFGICIDCHLRDGYRYYISNADILSQGELSRWLLDTYSTANALSQSMALKERILVEEIPSGRDFLTEIIGAMKENRTITITHRSFQNDQAYTFPVNPYCLKMFQKRWYLLALSTYDNKMRLYGLDRLEEVKPADGHFTLPGDFNAKAYFSTFFGIVLNEKIPVQRVVLRAYEQHPHYLRTLPLHPSQREIFTCADYTDFELTLRPTYDFIMELLRVGSMVEVMEPSSLRQQMREWVRDLWEMYEEECPAPTSGHAGIKKQ